MNTAIIHRGRTSRQRGFTLVEMLIVAALIAIFSSLAVINISTQMNLNKQKAAVAECRQIATAMSFAHDDLGIFPKICFLKFNLPNLTELLQGTPVVNNMVFESYGNPVGDLGSRLSRQWKGGYMSFNTDKIVKMSMPGLTPEVDWPADPWGNPYAVYLVYSDPLATDPNNREQFIDNAGKSPNYLAAVVSYGRNSVPGLGDLPPQLEVDARKPLRVYDDVDIPARRYRLRHQEELNDDGFRVRRIDMVRSGAPLAAPDNVNLPRTRQAGSDDRIFEF